VKTPTPADIRAASLAAGHHFFDRKTMQFFGDTMRNFATRTDGDRVILYRRRPVRHALTGAWVYDPVTHDLRVLKLED
jgi:hypothetical protein